MNFRRVDRKKSSNKHKTREWETRIEKRACKLLEFLYFPASKSVSSSDKCECLFCGLFAINSATETDIRLHGLIYWCRKKILPLFFIILFFCLSVSSSLCHRCSSEKEVQIHSPTHMNRSEILYFTIYWCVLWWHKPIPIKAKVFSFCLFFARSVKRIRKTASIQINIEMKVKVLKKRFIFIFFLSPFQRSLFSRCFKILFQIGCIRYYFGCRFQMFDSRLRCFRVSSLGIRMLVEKESKWKRLKSTTETNNAYLYENTRKTFTRRTR